MVELWSLEELGLRSKGEDEVAQLSLEEDCFYSRSFNEVIIRTVNSLLHVTSKLSKRCFRNELSEHHS